MQPAPVSHAQRVSKALSERDDLMREIAAMRAQGATASPNLGKASALLTRFWGKATWQSREEILQSARWLLRVERM